jgi:plasmid stabilization system protein ParE
MLPNSDWRRVRKLAVLTPPVILWLRREAEYLAARNPVAARKLVKMIRAARQTLADYPNIGPQGRAPGTRRMVIGPYVLTVRLRRGESEIIHIRHGRQADKSKD